MNVDQKVLAAEQKLVTPELVEELQLICRSVNLHVDLSKLSHWKIGGVADCVVRPSGTDQLAAIVRLLNSRHVPYVVIGSTSNLLFSDSGLRAVAIQIGVEMSAVRISGHQVWCQSGVWVPRFSRKLAQAGLSGAEHICGIPGTVGGLVCMNGGTQRKGIGDHLSRVLTVTPEGDIKYYSRAECHFAYRSTVFQENGAIISEAEFEFPGRCASRVIHREMLGILQSRRRRFPQKLPNCGSVFKSNPAMYAEIGPPGAVIERLGFKGYRIGGAVVSRQHANFIVNEGAASAVDVITLIHKIQQTVQISTGYRMEAEAKYISALGKVWAADSPFGLEAERASF